jgi:hypothetical protein
MDRTATPNRRMANVEQGFERSRLSEEVLASAYERLVPLVCRSAGLPREYSPTRRVERQPRQARRAS